MVAVGTPDRWLRLVHGSLLGLVAIVLLPVADCTSNHPFVDPLLLGEESSGTGCRHGTIRFATALWVPVRLNQNNVAVRRCGRPKSTGLLRLNLGHRGLAFVRTETDATSTKDRWCLG